jgi:hypothetical protein
MKATCEQQLTSQQKHDPFVSMEAEEICERSSWRAKKSKQNSSSEKDRNTRQKVAMKTISNIRRNY